MPERHRDAEKLRRRNRDAQREREDGEREELARASGRDARQQPRHDPPAADEDERGQDCDLEGREPKAGGHARIARAPTVDRRHHDEHEDSQQIFDDEPADRDVSGPRVQVAIVGEDPDEDNRAGDREADPKTSPAVDVQPNACDDHAQASGDNALRNCPGTATRQTATSSM